ncbi:MAG: hypothetical protein NTV75_10815 [Bacteroidia bacterium]|nr:hypothetical protein [Bacteroidia bacterium]
MTIVKRILKYLLLGLLGLIGLLLIIQFTPGIWHHWVTYPSYEKEVNELAKLRKEPSAQINLNTYRGVMHVHSYLSHDSRGTLDDLIPAAKTDGIDFIFLTDHPHGDIDTLPKGFRGFHDGVLIEPGTEKQGFCAWPLHPAIIKWNANRDSIAKKIVSNGGIVFYAHSEEEHNWINPDFQGMEIYNFHTDTKDQSPVPILFDVLVNGGAYRHWVLRQFFDPQTPILAHWDSLNNTRKIVGFSAIDAHENQNLRARYLPDGRIQWVGNNAHNLDTMEVKFWNKWIFSAPDKSGWVFKLLVDTYQTGFNYVTNYVMSDSLTTSSLGKNMKQGHLFIAFKSLGDAKGFQFYGTNSKDSITGILGDSIKIDQLKNLKASSPLPGQFTLVHNGKTINTSTANAYQFSFSEPIEKGTYRIEMSLNLQGKLIPWVYTNPIYIY